MPTRVDPQGYAIRPRLPDRHGFWSDFRAAAPMMAAGLGAGAVGAFAPALMGGGAAGAASGAGAAGAGAGAATAAGGGMGIPWMSIASLATGAGANLYGQSRANAANRRAQDMEQAAMQRQMEMLERNEATRREEWLSQQALQREAFQAEQEQMRLDRGERDYDRVEDRYRFERREPNARASYGGLVNLASHFGIDPGPYQPMAMPASYRDANLPPPAPPPMVPLSQFSRRGGT